MTTNDVSYTRISDERLKAYAALRDDDEPYANELRSMATELLASRTQSPAEWQVDAAWAKQAIEHIDTLHRLLLIIKEHWIDYDHVFSIAVHEAEMFMGAQTPPAPERSKEGEAVATLHVRTIGDFRSLDLELVEAGIKANIENMPDGSYSLYAAPAPVPVTITDGWPEAPEGWQRTKPTYVRSDGTLRVEFIYGRERSPWCVSWSLGNGACASLSYHATPQEALDAALATKVTGDATGTAAALSVKPGEQG